MPVKFKSRPKAANHRAFRPVKTPAKYTRTPAAAYVGKSLYGGYLDDGEFHYVTKGTGVQKTAKKFTVVS